MNDVFGKVFAILLCVWLMFLYPLQETKKESMKLEKMYLYQETVRFVDNIRNTGVIDSRDMEKYMQKVHGMNQKYQIQISYYSDSRQQDVLEILKSSDVCQMSYRDFLKIILEDIDGNLVVCYGGSVKAIQEEEKEV